MEFHLTGEYIQRAQMAPITRAAMVYILPGVKVKRARDVEEMYVLYWADEDVVIPWPAGMAPKQAILAWAREQESNQGRPTR